MEPRSRRDRLYVALVSRTDLACAARACVPEKHASDETGASRVVHTCYLTEQHTHGRSAAYVLRTRARPRT